MWDSSANKISNEGVVLMLAALIIAFSMYSILPMPHVEWKPKATRYALCFFPLVGVVIGGAVYGWLWISARLALSSSLCAAGAVGIPILLSGGIHMDGFCDTVDALASHASSVRKLEILKDPHAGAFAVIGCGVYLLIYFGLWTQYVFTPRSAVVLSLGFVLSRALSGFSVLVFRRARTDGLAAQLAGEHNRPRRAAIVPMVFAIISVGLMLDLQFVSGATVLGIVLVVFGYYRWSAYRNFGGVTGDLAGYFLQLCELSVVAAVIFAGVV